ncbi:MAG: hypothetical protein ABEI86_10350, partial [Halobacteriaceae archaeon]
TRKGHSSKLGVRLLTMTYEIPRNTSELIEAIVEDIHSDLATTFGRDNVLIGVDDTEQIQIEVEDGVGAM